MQQYFHYELTDLPSSLFKDETMKKTDKSSLAKELLKSVKNSPNAAAVTNIVLDGGNLLHNGNTMQHMMK